MWNKKKQSTFYLEQFKELIPKDDKFYIIKENIDFSFIDDLSKPYYKELGPTGYPPEKLFRSLLVMYLEGIRSERELEIRLRYDIRYRYFCDIDIADDIPDHSTFSVFRNRLGKEIFCKIFDRLVEEIFSLGIKAPTHLSVDSTSVLADCKVPRKKVKKSPVDKDASFGRKNWGKTCFFGYKAHNLVDSQSEIVLQTEVTTAKCADLPSAKQLLKKVKKRFDIKPQYLSADKAYGSISFREELKKDNIKAIIPQRKSGGKAGVFPKEMFSFNSDGDLVCPVGRVMKAMSNKGKKDFIEYRGSNCKSCQLLPKCTTSKRRRVSLSIHETERRIHKQFEQTDEFKALYAKRNSTERVNANLKRYHELKRAKFRSLWKVDFQLKMAATAYNLKKMAKWLAYRRPPDTKTVVM